MSSSLLPLPLRSLLSLNLPTTPVTGRLFPRARTRAPSEDRVRPTATHFSTHGNWSRPRYASPGFGKWRTPHRHRASLHHHSAPLAPLRDYAVSGREPDLGESRRLSAEQKSRPAAERPVEERGDVLPLREHAPPRVYAADESLHHRRDDRVLAVDLTEELIEDELVVGERLLLRAGQSEVQPCSRTGCTDSRARTVRRGAGPVDQVDRCRSQRLPAGRCRHTERDGMEVRVARSGPRKPGCGDRQTCGQPTGQHAAPGDGVTAVAGGTTVRHATHRHGRVSPRDGELISTS